MALASTDFRAGRCLGHVPGISSSFFFRRNSDLWSGFFTPSRLDYQSIIGQYTISLFFCPHNAWSWPISVITLGWGREPGRNSLVRQSGFLREDKRLPIQGCLSSRKIVYRAIISQWMLYLSLVDRNRLPGIDCWYHAKVMSNEIVAAVSR